MLKLAVIVLTITVLLLLWLVGSAFGALGDIGAGLAGNSSRRNRTPW